MNTKAFFPFGEGSNLILRIGRENQIFFSKTYGHCQVFSSNGGFSQKPFILQEKLNISWKLIKD